MSVWQPWTDADIHVIVTDGWIIAAMLCNSTTTALWMAEAR